MNLMNIMNIVSQVKQIKENPNGIAQFLYNNGRIDQNQMKDIEKMGGNYEEIGQYLMNKGLMPNQQQLSTMQPYLNQIQGALK